MAKSQEASSQTADAAASDNAKPVDAPAKPKGFQIHDPETGNDMVFAVDNVEDAIRGLNGGPDRKRAYSRKQLTITSL